MRSWKLCSRNRLARVSWASLVPTIVRPSTARLSMGQSRHELEALETAQQDIINYYFFKHRLSDRLIVCIYARLPRVVESSY